MTLAEELVQHMQPRTGFSAMFGSKLPLKVLVAPYLGKTIEVRPGVSITLPHTLDLKTRQLEDGSVQISFPEPNVPRLTAAIPMMTVGTNITGMVLNLGSEALRIDLRLEHFPDYTLTIPLDG